LQFLGRIRELGTRAHQMLRESTERTYPYVEGFARGILGNLVLLAADRPAEAGEQLAIYRSTAPKHFQGHMLNYVCQSAALKRYLGEPLEAWKLAEEDHVKVQKLDILRTEYARCELLLWRAASALAAASASTDRDALVRIAIDAGQTLLGLSASYRRGYGHLSLAGAHALKDQPDVAAGHLRQAISAFERHEMESFVAASKHRLADMIGGTEGDLLREEADRYLEREGVVDPARFIAMIAPGFDRP
jgi:hypothetical protein